MASTMTDSGRKMEREEQAGVERVLSNGRRVFTPAYKRWVVQQCQRAGASVSSVALSQGINANVVRKWIARERAVALPTQLPTPTHLIPVCVRAEVAASDKPPALANVSAGQAAPARTRVPCAIELDVHGATIKLHGPVDAQDLRTVLDALAPRR
jgi:transposase-like protein